MQPRLLVVDDDAQLVEDFCRILEQNGYSPAGAVSAEEAQRVIDEFFYDLLILDHSMPGMTGLELLASCQRRYPGIGAIFISGTLDPALKEKAEHAGAVRFLHKGALDPATLVGAVRSALDETQAAREKRGVEYSARARATFGEVVGTSPALVSAIEDAKRMSRARAPVLILGETGTGKELVARAIHHESGRREAPFIRVNAATISAELAESFLFGHRKGAFTGAVENRDGCFHAANHGTLFLDEVGELSLDCQSKLLRVLQEGAYTRVGDPADREIQVDVRVIAATNQDLAVRIAAGEFRSDLYYRLAALPLKLPALRERGDDVGVLAMHFLFAHSLEEGKPIYRITPEAMCKLRAYSWPGNIRQLSDVLRLAVVLAKSPVIGPEDIRGLDDSVAGKPVEPTWLRFKNAKEQFERRYFEQLWERAGHKIEAATEMAGLDRSTVYDYLKRLNIRTKR